MKKFERNFNLLKLKNEQLERKVAHLTEQHKHELLESRLAHETKMKDMVSRDISLELENTIFSLKQQVVYLKQRVNFLQQNGRRPSVHS